MPEAGQARHLVDEPAGEQAPRRHLAVPVDVREHDLVVFRSAGAPVQDLLAGQVLEDQLLVAVDVGGDGDSWNRPPVLLASDGPFLEGLGKCGERGSVDESGRPVDQYAGCVCLEDANTMAATPLRACGESARLVAGR
ncbi:hypothetical protein [Streptomyces sp. NPDC050759]|uniref:hypothetical protein n=1 Tax=Streptomyces sp. NPDC050759 TaxID=3365635 RepID=UPI0037959D92